MFEPLGVQLGVGLFGSDGQAQSLTRQAQNVQTKQSIPRWTANAK